jgi:hypothetical protein
LTWFDASRCNGSSLRENPITSESKSSDDRQRLAPRARESVLDLRMFEQCVQDRALGNIVAAALGGHAAEHTLQSLQTGQFLPYDCQVIDRHLMHLRAGYPLAINQLQQCPDILNAKSKRPASLDEGQTLEMLAIILPVSTGRAAGIGHDADSFIVANGLDIHRCSERQFTDT